MALAAAELWEVEPDQQLGRTVSSCRRLRAEAAEPADAARDEGRVETEHSHTVCQKCHCMHHTQILSVY